MTICQTYCSWRWPFWQMGRGRILSATSWDHAMPTEIFKASRWTRGNFIFPTYIEVDEKAVSRRKRSWFHSDEMSMSISKVASVHIKTGLIWSEIRIESSGGTDPLTSNGHHKTDAVRIKELIEVVQAEMARKPDDAE